LLPDTAESKDGRDRKLVDNLVKSEAQRMLRRATKANGEDGPGHKVAAGKLAAMLRSIEACQPIAATLGA
jgi:hypothetical protein